LRPRRRYHCKLDAPTRVSLKKYRRRREDASGLEEELRPIACGYSNWEIAVRLSVTVKTAKAHWASGMQKLRLMDRTALADNVVFRNWMKND
jgi:DNA-binding NarL/FixJ family response regulator